MTQITGCVVWFYFIFLIKMRKGKVVMAAIIMQNQRLIK